MPVDSATPATQNMVQLAREHLKIGPVPDWVLAGAHDATVPARPGAPLTYLYYSRQMHAETAEIHTRSVVRLDTMDAVQHESQWRLPLEPNTQTLVIHWIRIIRGETVREHADLDRLRILQREEGLEGFIIDGWFTLLLLLEDVRPGDILDSCFTIRSQPKLLPERFSAFFSLPAALPVAKYCFLARFAESRPLEWKSSSPTLSPAKSQTGTESIWIWSGKDYSGVPAEPDTPEWHMPYPWVQVSDFAGWGPIAAAVAGAWQETPEDPDVVAAIKEISEKGEDTSSRAGAAIRFIQDEYRYLSVDLELGGHVPAPPGTVARRRYGDCKDVSFLLVHILRGLGVVARPVLVNTRLRKSLQHLLPAPGLFNHVIVEYVLNGQTHWVDATSRGQGGSPLNPLIPDFGTGLPVDPQAQNLANAPRADYLQSVYELRESILLDTLGRPSLLGVVLRATGFYAEALRQQFASIPVQELEKEHLQACNSRFGHSERVGELKYRDDRNANEFCVAETFEIRNFLVRTDDPQTQLAVLTSHLLGTTFAVPDHQPRTAPLALPYPCNLIHTMEVQIKGLQMTSPPRQNIVSPHLKYSRTHKALSNFWSVTLSLTVTQDSVTPADLARYHHLVETIRSESSWQVPVPSGVPRSLKRPDFASLPAPTRKTPITPGASFGTLPPRDTPDPAKGFLLSTSAVVAKSNATAIAANKARRDQRRRDKKIQQVLWIVILIATILGLVGVFYLATR